MPTKSGSLNVGQVKSRHFSPTANTFPAVKIVKHSARNSREHKRPESPEPQTRHVKHETDKSASTGSSVSVLANSVPHHTDNLDQEEEEKFDLLRDGSV